MFYTPTLLPTPMPQETTTVNNHGGVPELSSTTATPTTQLVEKKPSDWNGNYADIIKALAVSCSNYLNTLPCIQRNPNAKQFLYTLQTYDYVLAYCQKFVVVDGEVDFDTVIKRFLNQFAIDEKELGFENFLYVKQTMKNIIAVYKKYGLKG